MVNVENFTFDQMTHSQKVATLLIALGPSTATEVLKNIPDEELIEQITIDIASLNKIPAEILDEVLEEFYSYFQASNLISRGGLEYAKKILEEAYGEEKAGSVIDKLASTRNNPFQFFNEADPSQLATSFQNETPHGQHPPFPGK